MLIKNQNINLCNISQSTVSQCRIVAPIMKSIAEEYKGKLKVGTLNVDQAPNTASKYGIMSIPALFLFKNGQVVNETIGAAPKEQIISTITPHI